MRLMAKLCLGVALAGLMLGCTDGSYNPGDPASEDSLRLGLLDCLLTRCWDPTWSIVSQSAGAGNDPTHLAVDGDSIYFSGNGGSGDKEWRLEKRSRLTGRLVQDFGVSGTVSVNPSVGVDAGRGLLVAGQKVYWVGEDFNAGDRRLRLMRLEAGSGAADSSFGSGGTLLNNPTAGNDHYRALASDGTYMYVIGNDSVPGDWQFRIEKREIATGTVATSSGFGTAGILTSNPSANPDEVLFGAVSGDALWLFGYHRSTGNNDWQLEKRSLSSGAYDTSFLGSGFYSPTLSNNDESPGTLCFSDLHVFAVGNDLSAGNGRWRIEKRSKANGTLDAAFGSAGVILEDIGSDGENDFPRSCAVAGSLLLVGGNANQSGQNRYRLEARSLVSGALIWSVAGDASLGTSFVSSLSADAFYVYAGIRTDQGWLLEKRHLATGKL